MKIFNKSQVAFGQFLGSGINVPLIKLLMGVLGIALPVVVVVWGLILHGSVQGSISDYYAWRTRDAFVGILFVIGWILFAYKGYEKMDAVAGKMACVFALGVALFPSADGSWERYVHLTCAALMFGILAFFSLFLFTKPEGSPAGYYRTVKSFRFKAVWRGEMVERERRNRNRVYVVCGIVIVVCILLVLINNLFLGKTVIANAKPVLILESIMIWAFGFAWFVKGRTLWKDKKPTESAVSQSTDTK